MSYEDPMSANYDPDRQNDVNNQIHGYGKYRDDGLTRFEPKNKYMDKEGWMLDVGYWIRTANMRKHQKITKIEGEKFGFRKYYLEPFGEFNNTEIMTISAYQQVSCLYHTIKDKHGDTWRKFKITR